ncbi:RssA, esterase alpha-beta hydrolase superfamily [Pyrenophora tritici-repentis]|uniref:Lysophospholipase NTE1 n=2 Tax=Pyrenophora tritici-repentis TaxID=45151 RepID=A0A834VKN1_9PLEO|nr:patatin-like serine hydrolase [Pyrenophora tritici-repentis Pt-1C-BFP]KAF7566409.1 RssA, esterase alpha-beta hydrolase superfamily [Pyrenophora tritici-repentis]EDU51414.1 patatin-like serine hydrolase [Pyrenophora tritici-repentis Pt-1C-BFP]KAI1519364.1 Patatin phospholipase [Pyrenophora tritici-repentis]KAI1666191.1 Patatin phospholipase [Pyrenophora tritici-repentis]KAI1679182.1 Patatin phospholipase [Pyrenophora tritici-repentis]
MATPGTATSRSLADVSKAAVYNTAEALSNSVLGMKSADTTTSSTSFGLLGRVVLSIFSVLPTILYWVTYTLPTWLFTLFSMSLTFTMSFTSLMLVVVFLVSTISWFVRYRYMTMYARLPPEPQREEPQVEVFPDSAESDSKRGLSNYLDEFLSAIKVFGYLERPVFHELTRTMQTRRLVAGETILLEEEKGFCLVVDGLVQIFVKSNRADSDSDDDMGGTESGDSAQQGHGQGYQLLTEVKNGAPMSSLFSILALFTEDVKLRHDEDPDTGPSVPGTPNGAQSRPSVSRTSSFALDNSRPQSPREVPEARLRHRRTSTLNSPTAGGRLERVPPLSLDLEEFGNERLKQPKTRKSPSRPAKPKSAHPDIVARATVDTTIAIIPATAFRRLTRIYPKATAHIVQVILTRLQRVTLATSHAYLSLTNEVLRTEKLMNKYTTYDLPGFLRDAPLERLKEKFAKETERIGEDEGMKGIALHNPGAGRRRRSSVSLRRGTAAQARLAAAREASATATAGSVALPKMTSPDQGPRNDRISAGDLLTNSQMARGAGRTGRSSFSQPYHQDRRDVRTPLDASSFNPFASPSLRPKTLHRQESIDEATVFRESILGCMFKAIGLTNLETPMPRATASVEQSPQLVSFDASRQKAVFTNAFGFIDPYAASRDGDTESIASASNLSGMGGMGSHNILEEIVNDVEIVFFPKDSVLVEQGERNPGLYYVIDGFLDVSVQVEEASEKNVFGTAPDGKGCTEEELFGSPLRPTSSNTVGRPPVDGSKKKRTRRSLFMTKPGGLAGYLGTVSSNRSFVDVTAKTDVYVGFLPRGSIEKIVERYPVVLLTMAKRLTTLLPRLIQHIDFALEWVQVNAGQVIYNQGDDSDAIYIVLNGRLRAIRDAENSAVKVIGEYGQGDSVGELEVLTESARPGSLHAIRDTELAKFPKTLFNSLALEHPGITIKISKIIASRMRALIDDPLHEQSKERNTKATRANVSSTINLRTVTILPVTAGIPVVDFASRLVNALTQIGLPQGVVSLNQAAILNHLGRHAFNRMGKLKLSQYLADLEERYGMVIYVADTPVKSPWTQTCINQADCILLVGLAEASPNIGEYERFLLTTKTTARKELVLLHSERYCPSGLTRKWLRNRPWINGSHHHIQMSFRATSEPVHHAGRRFGNALKQRVQVIQAEIQKYTSRKVRQTPLYSADTPFKGDFHRLARRLCGRSVGLVLGGGGARGISQIGIIRALEEAGIPIDIVGGTSIGSFIGALYAWDADVVPMYGRAKKFAGRMGSMWRFALDLTYPSASYTTGHEFNRGIFKTFGNSQMEDFWLEFYCNTTNISKSRSEIHTSGYVWRYVRASMSLAGLLPPLCDNGDMLLDGGYVDNLTVAHMKSLGADVIFAVDVGSLDDNAPQAFGDSLSGFWATLNRWNPFSSFPNPPTLSEIQSRLAYVSSIDALERAKNTPGCRYMRPPIDPYGTLDFAKFEEIYEVGYKYGKEYLAELREQGVLPVTEETEKEKNLRRTMAPRRASI